MTITTRRDEDQHAWAITVDGGVKSEPRPASHHRGTTVEVRDVFFATPARLKFLKSERTESANILDTVRRLAMARPDVSFTLMNDGRQSIKLPALADGDAESLLKRVVAIVGQEFETNSLAIDVSREDMRLHGLISLATYNRAAQDQQFIFVQGRAVRDRQLLSAVRAGFENACPRDRHPVVCLFLELPNAEVDVNAHPAKAEVRFRNAQAVRGLFVTAIRHGLMGAGSRSAVTGALASAFRSSYSPEFDATTHDGLANDTGTGAEILNTTGDEPGHSTSLWKPTAALPFAPTRQSPEYGGSGSSRFPSASMFSRTSGGDAQSRSGGAGSSSWSRDRSTVGNPDRGNPDIGRASFASPDGGADLINASQELYAPGFSLPDPDTQTADDDAHALSVYLPELAPGKNQEACPLGRAVGQIHSSYIVAETADGMILIDQHAAHERITYERLKEQFLHNGVASQGLLVPEIVELDEVEAALVVDWADELDKLGLRIEAFGTGAVLVRAVPVLLGKKLDIKAMLRDLATQIATEDDPKALRQEIHHFLATLACHTSIRAGHKLSLAEMDSLLRQMEATGMTGQCNHGRPTQVSLGLADIERLFERS